MFRLGISLSLNAQQLGGGAGPAFDPATLFDGERGAWYDPSDLSTLFQDTAGTIPVTTAGQPVARINDKSGQNNHATISTASARPTYQTSGTLHWLAFDGVNDQLQTPVITTGTDKLQSFAGVRTNASTGTFQFLWGLGQFSSAAGAASQSLVTNVETSARFSLNGAVANASSTATGLAVQPRTNVITALGGIDADLATLRVDGTVRATNALTLGDRNLINDRVYVGSLNGSSFFANMNLYSFIVRFGGDLDDATVNGVESYVAEKTGVAL